MTQLALLKRKINFAGDKHISHVIICRYIDKGMLGVQPHQNTSHTATPSTPTERHTPCWDGILAARLQDP